MEALEVNWSRPHFPEVQASRRCSLPYLLQHAARACKVKMEGLREMKWTLRCICSCGRAVILQVQEVGHQLHVQALSRACSNRCCSAASDRCSLQASHPAMLFLAPA
jgi:hypothetical protein